MLPIRKLKNVIRNLGFDSHYIVSSNGQSRGTWCVWKSNVWKVEVLQLEA